MLIVGIFVKDRIKEAGKTQQALSAHRRIIRTRLGFHEVNESKCSRNGLIILELKGSNSENNALISALAEIGGIDVKLMKFNK